MKKVFVFFIFILALALPLAANACVMKSVTVGVVTTDSPRPLVVAQLIATIVNERTGTKVEVKTFRSRKDLYAATKKEEVGIVVEDTANAARLLGRTGHTEDKAPDAVYEDIKSDYLKKKKLVWMKPLGFLVGLDGKQNAHTAPVVREEILINIFPGLPRVLNKLADKISDEILAKLTNQAESGMQAEDVAREFLKKIKLI